MKNKKKLSLVIGLVVVLILGIGGFAYTRMKQPAPAPGKETSTKKRISEPVNIIPAAERPVVYIWPVDSRNLSIEVASIKKPASQTEYELEYQAGTLLQGAFGSIELGALPARTKILLGSCSAGGACTYHTDIKGGTLLTRFSGGAESYALKADWKYFDGKETQISSKDGKFQLDSKALARLPFVIIFNGYGYPEGVKGTVVSEPYTLTSASSLTGTGNLTLRASEGGATAIMGWDGAKWHEFKATVDGKMLTAQVDLMQLYVAVK